MLIPASATLLSQHKLYVAHAVALMYTKLVKERVSLEQHATLEEACKILGISRHTAMRRLKSGALRGFRLGRQWLIPRDQLSGHATQSEPAAFATVRPLFVELSWLSDDLIGEDLDRVTNVVADLLRRGGAIVNRDGVREVISSKTPPHALFWRYLAQGARSILDPEAVEAERRALWGDVRPPD